jgi:hypothetical protein
MILSVCWLFMAVINAGIIGWWIQQCNRDADFIDLIVDGEIWRACSLQVKLFSLGFLAFFWGMCLSFAGEFHTGDIICASLAVPLTYFWQSIIGPLGGVGSWKMWKVTPRHKCKACGAHSFGDAQASCRRGPAPVYRQ